MKASPGSITIPSQEVAPVPRRRSLPFRSWIHTPIFPLLLNAVTIAFAILSDIDIARTTEKDLNSFSVQSVLKLGTIAVAGLLGAWGWWSQQEVRRFLTSIPGLLFGLFGIWFVLALPFSTIPKISFATSVANFAMLLFAVSSLAILGLERVLINIAIGLSIYILGSYAIYFVSKEHAYMIEVMSLTNKIPRFGGLGHPNTLGRDSVNLSIFLFGFALQKKIHWKWLIIFIPILVLTALSTKSRTPVLAAIIASFPIAFSYMQGWRRIQIAFICIAPMCLVSFLFFSMIDSDRIVGGVVSKFTKTGSMEEITTMTGRTEIWDFALKKAIEHPIFGTGLGTTPVVMAERSGYAHNILLQPTVCLGFPGGLIMLLILLWNGYWIFYATHPIVRVFLAFMLTVGMSESLHFGPLPESMTLLWILCSFAPLAPSIEPHRELETTKEIDLQPSKLTTVRPFPWI